MTDINAETTVSGAAETATEQTSATTQVTASWYEQAGIADEFRDIVSKYPNANEMAKGLANANKLISTRVPTEQSSKEEWDRYYNQMGRPETPDGYDLTREGTTLREDLTSGFKTVAHEHGLSRKQTSALLDWYLGMEKADMTKYEESRKQAIVDSQTALKKVWGANHEKFSSMAEAAAQQLFDEADVQYIKESGLTSDPRFIKAMYKVASVMSEDNLSVPKTINSSGVDIDARLNEIRYDKTSKDFVAYYNGNDPRHKEVMDEVRRLSAAKHAN